MLPRSFARSFLTSLSRGSGHPRLAPTENQTLNSGFMNAMRVFRIHFRLGFLTMLGLAALLAAAPVRADEGDTAAFKMLMQNVLANPQQYYGIRALLDGTYDMELTRH